MPSASSRASTCPAMGFASVVERAIQHDRGSRPFASLQPAAPYSLQRIRNPGLYIGPSAGGIASCRRTARTAKGDAAMQLASDLRAKLATGSPVFGVWAALPCGFAAELMCVPGVDYLCIDQQH